MESDTNNSNTGAAFLFVLVCFGVIVGGQAVAQYINGPTSPVTAGQFCAEMRGWIGMQRQGHTLRSISCSGSGRHFTVSVTID
jgi:hypothetical protein